MMSLHRHLYLLTASAVTVLSLQGCTSKDSANNPSNDSTTRIVLPKNPAQFSMRARSLGLDVAGDFIFTVTGPKNAIDQLKDQIDADAPYFEKVKLEDSTPGDATTSPTANFIAGEEFQRSEFLKQYPEADGRGVIAGVFDDGISPSQAGFQKTSTGLQKILRKGSQSSAGIVTLGEPEIQDHLQIRKGILRESLTWIEGKVDYNQDQKVNDLNVEVRKSENDTFICVDLDLNQNYSDDECKKDFRQSGEFFRVPHSANTFIAELSEDGKSVQFFQPEEVGDSHGEGVAAVMAASPENSRSISRGIAPGAQLVDYDISEKSHQVNETEYTIGALLKGFEWLAQNKAQVINVSYSLFFYSAASQEFMAKAIDALIDRYNVVFSFSAGNNGPGLGSMNRRSIYGDRALVVGAWVPKAMDEKVWGTTGLPEEGRVVHYSSRGPGPSSEQGPMIIAPLSSLTHSSPSEGYRAFNGTSSAAPAAAGAAILLISAIKQKGLPVDAPSVVHALRLSSRPLQDEPFIAQGYGVPKLLPALSIYEQIIQGKTPLVLRSRVNTSNVDGVFQRGVFLDASRASDTESFRLDLGAEFSRLVDPMVISDFHRKIEIEYPIGVEGSKELWLSKSTSRLHIRVKSNEFLSTKQEAFGSIRVKDSEQGIILHEFPITVIRSQKSSQTQTHQLTVSAQEGKRIHLMLQSHSTYCVRARILQGDPKNLNVAVFDPNRVRVSNRGPIEEFLINSTNSGHYQLTLSQNGGTSEVAKVEFEIRPLSIKLMSRGTSIIDPRVRIKNQSDFPIQGILRAVTSEKTLLEQFPGKDESGLFLETSLEITESGIYRAEMNPLNDADLRFLYTNCTLRIQHEDGRIEWRSGAYSNPDSKPKKLEAQCRAFDDGAPSTDKNHFSMQILYSESSSVTTPMTINAGAQTQSPLNGLKKGHYRLVWIHPISQDVMDLGPFQVW